MQQNLRLKYDFNLNKTLCDLFSLTLVFFFFFSIFFLKYGISILLYTKYLFGQFPLHILCQTRRVQASGIIIIIAIMTLLLLVVMYLCVCGIDVDTF
jgi:hypothetical protein